MIVVGYITKNSEDNTETETIVAEHEVLLDGQSAFNEMISEHSNSENVTMFFWGSRISPDEYQIVAYRDNEE